MHAMQRIALLNKQGLTLVEVMIALLIALIVFLALMQTALLSLNSNMRNTLRDEAVNIAEMRMNDAMSVPSSSLVSDTGSLVGCDCPAVFSASGICVARDLRKIRNFNFCTNLTSTALGSDNQQIVITVGWKWKGEDYTHTVTAIRKN
jgi:prepilin-type N-terminal cleavage/methylation domain-containing protein